MRVGRMIAAGTMAMGAYRAYKEYKGNGTPSKRSGGGRSPSRSRKGGESTKQGWLGTPFSIRH